MREALRIDSVGSGIYENGSISPPQQNNNRSTGHYPLPDTIDNTPRILIRSNWNQSSRPGSGKSLPPPNLRQLSIKAHENANNADKKAIASIFNEDFSDDEQEIILTTSQSAALTIQEHEYPTELPQSTILKELLLEHIQGHHKKKHIADVQAALDEYFSCGTMSSKKSSDETENRIRSLRFTNIDHLKGFLDTLLKNHKAKGKMYQLVAAFINNDAQLKKTLAINQKTPLRIKFIDNRPPIEPPFLAALSKTNKESAPITPSPSLIENNQSLPAASGSSDSADAISTTPKKITHPPLEKIDFSELNAQLKELLLAYIADTNNTKKHRGNVFTALNGKHGIKTVKSALEVETLIHSLDIQHIDQLGSILNLLLCARNPTRPFATSIQQLVETHPLLHDTFKFRVEKNHLVLGSRFALTPTSIAELNQSEGISPQGIEALLSALNIYYAEPKHAHKLDLDLASDPHLHRFLMRDRLPLIGDPSPKLIWVGSGPTKSAELDQLFDNLSKHHGKNSSLLKLIRPIYEQYFPMTEIGEKAIKIEKLKFKNARENAIQEAIQLDTLHMPRLNDQGKKYEQAKADFKSAWLMHLSAQDPQKNFERDVLPALKNFASTVLKEQEKIASFEAHQNKLKKEPLNANAMSVHALAQKLRHKTDVTLNTSLFEKNVKNLADNYKKQLNKELEGLLPPLTAQEKIQEKANKALDIAHKNFQKKALTSSNPFTLDNTQKDNLSRHIQVACYSEHASTMTQMVKIADDNFSTALAEGIEAFNFSKAIAASRKKKGDSSAIIDAAKESSSANVLKAWENTFHNTLTQHKAWQASILDSATKKIETHADQSKSAQLIDELRNSQSINNEKVRAAIHQQLRSYVSKLNTEDVTKRIISAVKAKSHANKRVENVQKNIDEYIQNIKTIRSAYARFDLNPDEVTDNTHEIVKAAYKNLPEPLGFRGTLTRTWRGLIAALGIGGASVVTTGGLLLGFGGAAMAALGGATLGIGLVVIGGIAILAAGGLLIKKLYDVFQEKTFLEREKNEFRQKYKDYLEERGSPSLRNKTALISK